MTEYLLIGGPANGKKVAIGYGRSILIVDTESGLRYSYAIGTYVDKFRREFNIATFDVNEAEIIAAINKFA